MGDLSTKPPPFSSTARALSAGALNMLRAAIPRLISGGPGISVKKFGDRLVVSLKDSAGAVPGASALATITEVRGTYLICDKDGAEIAVAKPWALRYGVQFPANGGDLSYVYNDYHTRTAASASGETTEFQRITPDYEVGEELLVRRVASARIFEDNGGPGIVWIDENNLGRCWAVPE